ncbi:CDP-alcohol phosphatidyltransferase [Arabidopsis suecica]|uniref:CDP-diacylglycerol--glycerol-3-phosphate 1-phosphatidyltransferase n=1 Tax=Arabidopsis suecica TaxID=45249 RepID=A0A8T2AJV4_ARASU|nr:CDP-alcohol phosphatidyltransferase [Arabidopsis suecica]
MLRSGLASLIVDVNLRRTLRPSPTFSFPAHLSRCIITSRYSSRTALRFPIRISLHNHRLSCFSSSSSSEQGRPTSSSRNSFSGHGQLDGDDNSSPPPSQSSSKVLTLPTVLTLGRVAAVPLLVATFYVDGWWGATATTSIFIAAAITDWLDGYLARKMRLGSAFGAFLDPVADKLMVAATLILLCTKPIEVAELGPVPWLLTVPSIAIIGREITMSAVREWAASQNGKLLEAVAVNNLGKWKTATQMTALTILLASRDSNVGWLVASGAGLLYVSAGLSVWSLAVYMRKIWKVLMK